MIKYYSQYISHSGILGQKWGVRRYQNEDGTYTEEGKARRRKEYRVEERLSDDEKRKRYLMSKNRSELSNKELEDLNRRLNLEQNYDRLIGSGKKKVKDYVSDLANKTTNKLFDKASEKIAAAAVAAGSAYIAAHSAELMILIKAIPIFLAL